MVSLAEKLVSELNDLGEIEKQSMKIEQRSKTREEEIKKKSLDFDRIDIDKIRRRNGSYIKFDRKKEEAITDEEKTKFLEASWDIERNRNVCLLNQKRVYQRELQKAHAALDAFKLEFAQFAITKRDQIRILQDIKNEQIFKLEDLEDKYQTLGEKTWKLTLNENPKLINLGVVPYVSDKMDDFFSEKLAEMNLGLKELKVFKSFKSNILEKVQYLLSLLKRKESEKDQVDHENDLEIQFYIKQRETLQKAAKQSIEKQKQASDLLTTMKKEYQRMLDFMYKEKKRIERLPIEINQLKRKIRKLEEEKKKLMDAEKKRLEDHAKNNTLDKRVEVVIAKAKEKQQKKLMQQKKQLQAQKPEIKPEIQVEIKEESIEEDLLSRSSGRINQLSASNKSVGVASHKSNFEKKSERMNETGNK